MYSSTETMQEADIRRKEAEFQSILNSLPEVSSHLDVLQELVQLHGLVLHAEHAKHLVPGLSADSRKFLRENLLLSPVYGNAIIQSLLCVWSAHFRETDNELQNVYIEALKLCVLELKNRSGKSQIEKSLIPDGLRYQNSEQLCSLLLCILSIFRMSDEKENVFLEHFCPQLLELCELGVLSRQLLYLAFISRKKLKVGRLYMNQEDCSQHRYSSLSDEKIIRKVCGKLFNSIGTVDVEEMFLRSVKQNRHWIEDLVDIFGQLVISGDHESVEKYLSQESMSKIWPLILLHVWKTSASDEGFDVLSFLIAQCKAAVSDPTVTSLCLLMEHQILVVQWCKKYGQKFSLNNKDFLELAREFSSLEVLRRTTNLENLEWNDVRKLLLLSNRIGVQSVPEEQSPEIVSWEVATFDGFCILRKAFQILQAAMEIHQLSKKVHRYNSLLSANDELLRSMIPVYFSQNQPSVLKNSSLESENESYSPEAIKTLYKERVLDELEQIKIMVSQLQPLNFRVEILEDLFSLLFLRYEYLQEESSSESGAEDCEGDQESKSKANVLSEVNSCDASLQSCEGDPFPSDINQDITDFHLENDVSSKLRTITVIEAHVSDSPPVEITGSLPDADMRDISVSLRGSQSSEYQGVISPKTDVSTHSYSSSKKSVSSFVSTKQTVSDMFQRDSIVTGAVAQGTKVTVVDSRERKKSIRSNRSSAPSVVSNATHHGFVCNEYLVCNLLLCLKDCLLETNSAIYRTLSKDTVIAGNTKELSSIEPESIQDHTKRLMQYVNQGLWRLELLTDVDTTSESYQDTLFEHLTSVNVGHHDWLYASEESESEDELESVPTGGIQPSKQHVSYRRSKSETDKSSESGSQTTAGGTKQSSLPHRNQKVRWNKSQQLHNLQVASSNNIVNLMLSPYSSLIVQCLTNGEIEKAKQVIEFSGMEDNSLDKEVKFIEKFQSLFNDLRETVLNIQKVSTTKVTKRASTLESIKEVASAGIHSTSLTSQVERFLSCMTIPGVQGAERIIKDFPHEASMLEGIDSTAAMVTLDLAVTVCGTHEQSASLLDLACKKCGLLEKHISSSDMSISRNKSRNVVPGYIQFGGNVIELLKEANMQSSKNHDDVFNKNVSLAELVTSEHFPLSLKPFKDYISFWRHLREAVSEFENSLSNDNADNKAQYNFPRSEYSKQSVISKVKPQAVFRKIVDIFRGYGSEGRNQGNYLFYVQQLYTYLKLITLLIHQPTEKVQSTSWMNPGKYFDLLDDSLLDLIGQLLFDLNVSPTVLEPITNTLKLNLVYSVVCNCCPKIPNSPLWSSVKHSHDGAWNWGRLILNNTQQWNGQVRHPEVAVRCLLSDVLQVIQEQSENFADFNKNVLERHHISALADNLNVKNILMETCELTVIDTDILTPGDESLVFYTNLANLMWIHSLIILEAMPQSADWCYFGLGAASSEQKESANFGLYSEYSLERQLSRKCVGYNVGKLGFISLHAVYQHLLGELNFPPGSTLKSDTALGSILNQKSLAVDSDCDSASVDPRVLFALLNDRKQSPKVKVLFVESLDVQLDSSMTDFLNVSVKLNLDSQVSLIIPELLQLYQDFVLLNQEPESHSSVPAVSGSRAIHHFLLSEDENQISTVYSRERLSQLIEFLRDNTSGGLQSQINAFVTSIATSQVDPNGTIVTIEKSVVEYGIVLDYGETESSFIRKCRSLTLTTISDIPEDTWKHREVEEPVMKYLEQHCWLLSVLVQMIHKQKSLHATSVKDTSDDIVHVRNKCLEQLFRSDWVSTLKQCFHNNSIVAALHSKPNKADFWSFMDALIKKNEWYQCADILWSLPECEMLSDPKLQTFHDTIMYELASRSPNKGSAETQPWWYCQQIGDVYVQTQCLLQNLSKWNAHDCQEALKVLLENREESLSLELKSQLQHLLHKVNIYEKILPYTMHSGLNSWYKVSNASENNPGLIMEILMEYKQFQVCLMWLNLYNFSTSALHLINSKFLLLFLEHDPSSFETVLKLLQSLPPLETVKISKELLFQLKILNWLKELTNFLLDSYLSYLSADDVEKFHVLLIGIQVTALLSPSEQEQHWNLVWEPHLLMEQFIMNTRLEMLEKVIAEIRPMIAQVSEDSPISIRNFDSLLRQYAAKALDFRVIHKPSVFHASATEEKLHCILSPVKSQVFLMPAVVPSKEKWVPNEEVSKCMCCRSVAFSMFNRRHHCRRCGRVICGSCSMQRTKVDGYGSVPVRVCNDCYSHMESQEEQNITVENQPLFSLDSGELINPTFIWKLTTDEDYNTTVREEFSFEYAPSVSLCLAILKLHSDHIELPRFLLDQCNRMLQLLQPVRPGVANPEVDYSLVIRMVRSLAIAAKVRYDARAGPNTGVDQCDQLLSQVDLLSTLVKHGRSALIPAECLTAQGLRRLRDRLLEEEEWSLALEVSRKCGLESSGVWAAWGKACLRTGCWNEAWEKFARCFDKIPDISQPARNPRLLNDIIQILEDGSCAVNQKLVHTAEKIRSGNAGSVPLSTQALSVLHRLSSLNEIIEGNYSQAVSSLDTVVIGSKIDPRFYRECSRYLTTYGSHAGIIRFYLRHEDFKEALKYVLLKRLEPDFFFENVYIPCLRECQITDLHWALSSMDETLSKWKDYLGYVCFQLEKKDMLNILYELQLFLKDRVRASMTCIRFYQMDAQSYKDLYNKLYHLKSAKKHLEEELNIMRKRKTSIGSKQDTTSSLSLKMDHKRLDHYIKTIDLQERVNEYLYEQEQKHEVLGHLQSILQYWPLNLSPKPVTRVPTVCGSKEESSVVAVLTILCGQHLSDSFSIANRIIDHFSLEALHIYSLAAKTLAHDKRLMEIKELSETIRNYSNVSNFVSLCDEVLCEAVRVLGQKEDPGDVESLVKLITDVERKISAYIECRLLKAAYLLAVKSNRIDDVKKILEVAKQLKQAQVERLCLQRLKQ